MVCENGGKDEDEITACDLCWRGRGVRQYFVHKRLRETHPVRQQPALGLLVMEKECVDICPHFWFFIL